MPGVLVWRRSSTLSTTPVGVSIVAAQRFMQVCGRLVARMSKQDVDRDSGASVEIDGSDMPLVMGDLDDPSVDDRYVAVRQIGLDIRCNVVTIGKDSQPVGPIEEQPDLVVRLRAGHTRPQCWPAASKPSQ